MVQNPILLLVSIASFLTVNTQHATLQPFNPSTLQPPEVPGSRAAGGGGVAEADGMYHKGLVLHVC